MANGRKVQEAAVRFTAVQQARLFLGNSMPSTIVRKEMLDNIIDVVSERKMPAHKAIFKMSPNRLQVMDDGYGISTANNGENDTTDLWKAVSKLFTSSNYKGESDTVGAHGVGATISNLTSFKSSFLVFRGPKTLKSASNRMYQSKVDDAGLVKGYQFTHGLLNGSPEEIKETKYQEDAIKELRDSMGKDAHYFDAYLNGVDVESGIGMYRCLDDNQIVTKTFRLGNRVFEKGLDTSNMGSYHNMKLSGGFEIPKDIIDKYIDIVTPDPGEQYTDTNGLVLNKDDAFDGDLVSNPRDFEEMKEKYNPEFDVGYYVDILWSSMPSPVFLDGGADLSWLMNYVMERVAEMSSPGLIECIIYKDDDFLEEEERHAWTNVNYADYNYKDAKNLQGRMKNIRQEFTDAAIDKIEYLPSWDVKVKHMNTYVRTVDDFTVAVSKDPLDIDPIVQGAPVQRKSDNYIRMPFSIDGKNVTVDIPYTFKYESTKYPNYSDQTKVSIALPGEQIRTVISSSGSIYEYFYKKASDQIVKNQLKSNDTGNVWPCTGPTEEGELIIAEGFSAGDAIASHRDAVTQAVVGLRGVIKNSYRDPITKAIQNKTINNVLYEITHHKYKQIIIATDADEDGLGHIAVLLIGIFAKYSDLIQEQKVKVLYTPHYTFKKPRSQEIKWSEHVEDCPRGWTVKTNKGLGSLQDNEVKYFITNKETRNLTTLLWSGERSNEALENALVYGGKQWIGSK